MGLNDVIKDFELANLSLNIISLLFVSYLIFITYGNVYNSKGLSYYIYNFIWFLGLVVPFIVIVLISIVLSKENDIKIDSQEDVESNKFIKKPMYLFGIVMGFILFCGLAFNSVYVELYLNKLKFNNYTKINVTTIIDFISFLFLAIMFINIGLFIDTK